MTLTPARRLILLYAFLTALTFPYVALARDVSYGDSGEVVFGVAIWALIVWRMWEGSEVAWLFAVILDVLMIVALFLMQPGLRPTPFVLLAIAVGHLMILFSRPVRAHVRTPGDTRLASG